MGGLGGSPPIRVSPNTTKFCLRSVPFPLAPSITSIGGSDSTVSGVTGDAQVVGTAEANSTVTIRTGTTVLGTATADSNGNWAYTLTSANITTLGQGGNKSINAIQTDAAGNQGTTASAAFTFSVDNVAPGVPTITSIGGADNTVSSVAGDNLVVGTAEANSTGNFRFEVVNGQLKLKDGQSLDYESLTNGQLTVTVTATDSTLPAGSNSVSQAFTINVSDVNEAPELTGTTAILEGDSFS